MSILVISDLHFEKEFFHGVYQGGALDWLLGVVDNTKPTTLVGLVTGNLRGLVKTGICLLKKF